jgi:hypothetical protein
MSTCLVAEQDGKTILTLTQDNNATQAEAETTARDSWGPMLEGLKKTAEE